MKKIRMLVMVLLAMLGWVSSFSQTTNKKPQVLIFLATGCPCAYNHQETFNSLINDYKEQIDFAAIFVDPKDYVGDIRDMLRNIGWQIKFSIDSKKLYRQRYHPKVTTECILIAPSGKIIYRGAVDDGPMNAGLVKNFYLRMALEEYFSNIPIKIKEGKLLGCSIL